MYKGGKFDREGATSAKKYKLATDENQMHTDLEPWISRGRILRSFLGDLCGFAVVPRL
jgi:hypothetical protein